jgi:WhiB family transcriptional regulator, redox-sensing transcriptional regulator
MSTHGHSDAQWRDAALCRQTDPELFFPDKGGSCEPAKRVCRVCPVRGECLDHAIRHHETDGVWGGLSPRQRRRITPPRRRRLRTSRTAA